MGRVTFTGEQRQAVETIDRSVVVTAAAGSGKTAVLTGRCEYLLCDAPPSQRCSVDSLLVVTFTEAAAAEMRSRIHAAIRGRLADRPHDGRLRTQLGLIETAQISTIHAFCLWIIRRWFHLAGVDAAAVVLDEDEARLLQQGVMEGLFAELYESSEPLGEGFRQLVELYGLGRDGALAILVRKLAAYVGSQTEPEKWLKAAVWGVREGAEETIDILREHLGAEIVWQVAECEKLARRIGESPSAAAFYGGLIAGYQQALIEWRDALDEGAAFDEVQETINAFTLSSKGAPTLGKNADPDVLAARDRARDHFTFAKEKLFERRLRKRFARFTADELVEGLHTVAPHVETLVTLVRLFVARYAAEKRLAGALDFADLERHAYRLLCRPDESVSRVLRDRFRHVLVDEYQDINPLQDAILKRVSREGQPGAGGNLFTVGDVKQSIYRFRLAEPELLLQREVDFDAPGAAGLCVRLQRNYRSRATILKAVNLLFRPIMRKAVGGIEYDDRAALRPGDDARQAGGVPVEMHVLDRLVAAPNEEAEGADKSTPPRFVDVADPSTWRDAEREAYLIGRRIQAVVSGGEFRYADVAILLRSAAYTASVMVEFLAKMGIPAYAEGRGALFETLEVREVLSLLQVLDNPQQDIPLAAVLRAGVLGDRFNEDELATIRLHDRAVPFHEVAARYAQDGTDASLAIRLRAMWQAIHRYRQDARQRPLADVLWRILQETGYLAYVGGLRGGAQRRANLLRLHERARQFGTFQRQGLHRFLAFIESLREEDGDFGLASALGESENVVRIMTIHASKGLEFPVVFLAGLGRAFNLQDARGRMLYDRQAGIGLKVIDRERMIEYPCALHHLVTEQVESATRAEEMRLLYVALTRARERLILVGTTALAGVESAWQDCDSEEPITPLRIASAGSVMDWIIPVLAAAPPDQVCRLTDATPSGNPEATLYEVYLHTSEAMSAWRLEEASPAAESGLLTAVAGLGPLPTDEPVGGQVSKADEIVERLDYAYPHLAESSIRAVVAASELKRPFDALGDPDDQPRERISASSAFEVPSLIGMGEGPVTAAELGTATHRLLQFMALDAADGSAAVAQETARLVDRGVLTPAEAAAVDVDAVAWFLTTPLGCRVRQAGASFRREEMFLSTERADVFDPTVGDCSVPVVVRGIVDGVLLAGDGLELLDYKTDRIVARDASARAETYRMQMRLYARAMARCHGRPVRRCWLVFLHPRVVHEFSVD